jgi:putative hydrolase of the HAD superfamily
MKTERNSAFVKYDAVIFDLYGTLVDNFPGAAFDRTAADMASCLGLPLQDFTLLWNVDTWPMRVVGHFPTTEANIEHICDLLDVTVEEALVKTAAQIRFDFSRRILIPRDDAVETLKTLKSAGYKTGLISDCSLEVPLLWSELPFAPFIDAPIFSCSVKLKKPDPRIFLLACEQLAVEPERCLYIGDGGSRELTGATAVGMDAVLIRVPYEEVDEGSQAEVFQWQGDRITAIKEILAFVDR